MVRQQERAIQRDPSGLWSMMAVMGGGLFILFIWMIIGAINTPTFDHNTNQQYIREHVFKPEEVKKVVFLNHSTTWGDIYIADVDYLLPFEDKRGELIHTTNTFWVGCKGQPFRSTPDCKFLRMDHGVLGTMYDRLDPEFERQQQLKRNHRNNE